MAKGQTVILRGDSQRDLAKSLVDRAPPNAVVTIKEEGRTPDQNAKMHAMLSDISRAKPEGRRHTPDVWKALMLNACGYAVQFEVGLNGQPFPVGFRSSRLTKAEMTDLLSFMDCWGTENGVVWSEKYDG